MQEGRFSRRVTGEVLGESVWEVWQNVSGLGLVCASFEEVRGSWMKQQRRIFQVDRRDWRKPRDVKNFTFKGTTGTW